MTHSVVDIHSEFVACGKEAWRCNWTTLPAGVTCEACKIALERDAVRERSAELLAALEDGLSALEKLNAGDTKIANAARAAIAKVRAGA